MIGPADVEKLRAIRATQPAVLSLYLPVPLDPAELRELPARADDLIASAAASDGAQLPEADRDALEQLIAARGREWLGHTVAIFSCGELGLLEALPLPGRVGARAVLATSPHIRPILAALQRTPAYLAAVIDRQHGWLLSITGDDVETIEALAAPGVRSARFGGWYGLESYRVQQRVTQLARHHYRDVVTILAREARTGGDRPLVIGGQPDGVAQLLSLLPEHLRAQYAGSFTADPHTLTAARVRELAGPCWPAGCPGTSSSSWLTCRSEPIPSPASPPAWPRSTAGRPAAHSRRQAGPGIRLRPVRCDQPHRR